MSLINCIVKKSETEYETHIMIQDGVEHGGPYKSEAEAIEHFVSDYYFWNHFNVDPSKIEIYEWQPVVEHKLVRIK